MRFIRLLSYLLLPLLTSGVHERRIRGINYYGLETPSRDFVCGWQHRPSFYLGHLDRLGFNSIRLPFSLEYVRQGNFDKMDEFFETIKAYPNMTVTLDMHRVFSSHQGPTPTEDWITMDTFLEGWRTIIRRYRNHPQLHGIDVFNEYQGTDSNYWNGVLRTIVKDIEKAFPDRFEYFVGGIRWGGDIHDIDLEDLPFADRIHYTIHKYIFSTVGYDREKDWDFSFGPFKNRTSKVSVGEWGFKSERWDEVNWAKEFVTYLRKHDLRDTYFWTIAHSGDTGGLWHDDCETIDMSKFEIIQSLWNTTTPSSPSTSSTTTSPTTASPSTTVNPNPLSWLRGGN